MLRLPCACVVVVGLVLAWAGEPCAAKDLVVNGGFEAEPAPGQVVPGWTANAEMAEQAVWLDAREPHSGRKCVAIRALSATAGPGVLSQEVPVQPDQNYVLTLWARRDSFVYGTRFEVGLFSGKKSVGTQTDTFRGTAWTPVCMAFESGKADRAVVRIVNPSVGSGRITVGRTLWVDGVSLVRADHAGDILLDAAGKDRLKAEVPVEDPGPRYLWARVWCPGPNTLALLASGRSWEFRSNTPGQS